MKKNPLINILNRYRYEDLISENYSSKSLSIDEIIMLKERKIDNGITVEEFANKYDGDTLSILYKDNEQVGFVRLTSTTEHTLCPIKTPQNIIFNVEHPENGLISFNLNEFRKKEY